MLELKDVLGLPTLPLRIEGYDISNTMGQQSVAAMVVFENGLPAKKAYRIYKIKTVEGANDFASMHEVITRRLSHGLEERAQRLEDGLDPDGGSFSKLPDVILIDGGPQQVAFAQDAMHALNVDIPMFGLAEKFEEIYLPDRPDDPIVLDRRSNALHLVQFVRDEAHRFGITHHRALRGKANLKSKLSEIEGIGPKKQQALIRHFRSVKAIFEATKEELMQVEGITENIAIYLSMIKDVSRYYLVNQPDQPQLLQSIDACARYMRPNFVGRSNETVFLLCLDAKCKVLCCKKISEGSVISTPISSRKVVETALNAKAASVVLAHNHPSGIAIPSPEDVAVTRRLSSTLNGVDVILVDHIVFGDDGDYVSMVQSRKYAPELRDNVQVIGG